ncbi:HAE1 family hydrophobic/amphiphilic exporter-1 [Cytobacillus firmus]|uniref:HAE1 family hydrophobic/amphiphilic exporter-1 n=2 Tax=Cytobacillus TaxID=2675230 RepID=A0A366JY47_CYTFI|nr:MULTISPECIES: efflux RND transporter permease subunit [Cytobacillus]RBP92989.1 HAE1 family hydrophobic/amphiphilic exporter-1 [Cytobacillus firmus]TDX42591.1 HAE1 family hydrophobic/amphiphilic exporter-1 [Cytobacillus oceanisediminis]
MKLLKMIVQRKILVALMTVLILAIGSFSIIELDKELMPPVTMDGAYVEVSAGEMAAIEVERSITNPLEQQIRGIEGVDSVVSTSAIGRSSLQITFEQGRGDELFKEVETAANAAKGENAAITDVTSGQYGTTQSYEFYMDVSGGSMEEMTTFAKKVLEPRLEALPEVRDVSLAGVQEHEVIIELDRSKLAEKGVDSAAVMGAIQQVNSEATLGELSSDANSPSLRWNTKLENVEDVQNIKIPSQNGFVDLKDVADVQFQPIKSSSFVWKNGTKDFIFVQVGRAAGATQIDMAAAVRDEVKNIREDGLVKGFELNEMVAQADYVQESIEGVTGNILIGGVIAIAILLLFLRNVRATFIIGLSIPTSILLTFTAMWVFDYSFNILTLIGLGLGIGMMVDSSIVIIESIYRKKEQGLGKLESVLEGTKEVSSAVIASMLTTIVVFLPIGLIGGDVGTFMIMLSAVVAITLISSVIVSFTLIPSLSEKLLKLRKPKKERKEGPIMHLYSRIVAWTIRKKRYSFAVIAIFFLMFAGSLTLVTKIPMTIMPDMFNRYTELMVDLETGISIEDKEDIAQGINQKLQSIEDVESNYVMDTGGMFYAIINMTKGDDITREQKDVNEDIMKQLRSLSDSLPVKNVQSAMSAGSGSPVQVNITGEDFADLQKLTGDFSEELEKIDGIVGVTNTMERTSEEQVVVLKEEAIETAGLTQLQIRQFIEQTFMEMPVGEMAMNEENVPLALKWAEKTDSRSDLLDLKVPTAQGEKALSSFIEFKSVDSPNDISHHDGERFISISADIEGKDLGAVNRDVQKLINDFEAPAGYSVAAAGDLEQQQELIMDMVFVLAIAIFLVYLVMAVQFNHLGHPLIVMSVIPMTIIGVILGLFLTQMELSVMSGMGIVMLIGIVLNNAILLIDRTNQLRLEGFSVEEALLEAGKNRIRPIFMTTLTTVGGMLPLALASGTSGNYQAPMAMVIISGLLFATFITLLLIPAVYRLFTTSSLRFGWMKKKQKKKSSDAKVIPETVK